MESRTDNQDGIWARPEAVACNDGLDVFVMENLCDVITVFLKGL